MYKHPPTKRQKKIFKALALTRKVLLFLADFETPEIFNPFAYWRGDWTREDAEYAEAMRMKRAFKALKEKKYIEIRKNGDKVMYILTDKGKLAALKEKVRLAGDLKDGNILLISFDIPERENEVRNKIRYMLKDFGFKMFQQSLWGTKQDVGSHLAELVKDMGVQKWIRLFLSTEITNS
jgi:DNA-binding transcriptional regulator PaaX